jgi:hypothetical protein
MPEMQRNALRQEEQEVRYELQMAEEFAWEYIEGHILLLGMTCGPMCQLSVCSLGTNSLSFSFSTEVQLEGVAEFGDDDGYAV